MTSINFSNGDEMPIIGLGTWKSKPGEVKVAVISAIKEGYRHIDCAPIYGNEFEVGEAIAECIAKGLVKREELWITSKLWNNAHRRENMVPAIKKTLSDLKLDYLDLYLIHWPIVHKPDIVNPKEGNDFININEVPLTETWNGMIELKKAGLTKHIGVANFNSKNLNELIKNCEEKPEMNQVELHPFLQQIELLQFCKTQSIQLTAYSPLGSGAESRKGDHIPVILGHEVIVQIADKHKCTAAQVLLSWAIKRGTVIIPKSVNPNRIAENLASQNIKLDEEDMIKISGLDRQYRYVDGTFWTFEGSPYDLDFLWAEENVII